MTKLWCKLWNFLLNIFNSVIEGVGVLLKTVGTVLVDVLGGVASAVGDALGLSGGTILWLAIGGAALYFLSRDDDKPKIITVNGDPGGGIQQASGGGYQPLIANSNSGDVNGTY